VGVSVIAELDTVFGPQAEGFDAVVDVAQIVIEAAFIDEADGGDLLIGESGDDFGIHLDELFAAHGVGAGAGQVVDGDADFAIGSLGESA
jgi:hypothetical protein